MDFELLSYFQIFAILIGLAGIHTFMPIVLYQVWISHKLGKPFDFSSCKCWTFPSFILSCISVIIVLGCVTIPVIINSIVSFFE